MARTYLPAAVAVGVATFVGTIPVLPYVLVASRGFLVQAFAWAAVVGATAAALTLLTTRRPGRHSAPFALGVSSAGAAFVGWLCLYLFLDGEERIDSIVMGTVWGLVVAVAGSGTCLAVARLRQP